MPSSPFLCLGIVIALGNLAPCWGQSPLLEKAATMTLQARTAGDWNAIAQLVEQALQDDLSETEQSFAEQLLAKAYVGKSRAIVEAIQSRLGIQQFRQQTLPQLRLRALVDLEEAVRISPKLWEAHLLIAKLHLFPGGEPTRAKEALDEAYELTNAIPHAQATVLALRGGLQNEPEATIADYNQAIELAPQDTRLYRARGLWLARQGDRDKAIADLATAIEIDPRNEQSQQMYVKVLAEALPADQALQNLASAIERFPMQPVFYFSRSRLLAAQKKWKAAKADLDQAIALRPNWNAARLVRVEVCGRIGEWETALADVQTMLEIAPLNEKLVETEPVLLLRLKRTEQAITQLEASMLRGAATAPLFHLLGTIYASTGKPKHAVSAFERAVEIDAKHVASWQAVSGLYLSVGEHAKAVAAFREVVELKPADAMSLNNLAWLLATSPSDELRNGNEAVEIATKACEQTKFEQPTIVHTLAAAHAEAGDFDKALEFLDKAAALDTDGKIAEIKQHRELFEQMQPVREPAN